MLLIPAPRINPSYKPDFPVELDPEHPLRNSILAAYYHQGNAENLVNGVIANYASGVTNGVNANGRTINFSGATSLVDYSATTLAPTNSYTFIAEVVPTAVSAGPYSILDHDIPGVLRAFQFRIDASNFQFIPFDTSANPYTITNPTVLVAGETYFFCATITGGITAAWVNGVKTAGTASGTIQAVPTEILVGQYSGNATQSYFGAINYWLMFQGTLSDSDISSLFDNPYQLLRPRQRNVWFQVSGGGGGGTNYTLTLSGSLTPGGAYQRAIAREVVGTLSAGGSIQRGTTRSLPASIPILGILQKGTARSLPASLTPSGVESSQMGIGLSLTGSITPTGSIQKGVTRTLTAAISPTGSIQRGITRTLTAAISASGSIQRGLTRTLSASIILGGALIETIGLTLSVAGSITASAVVSMVKGVVSAFRSFLTLLGVGS